MREKELVAFYNVENLFDTIDDPNTFDDEFTPQGKRHWTPRRYENKIYKIARAITEIGEKENTAPFLIGLTEIENKKVLNDLIHHLPDYQYIHYDSSDERGIDTALLYQPKNFLVTHSEPIYVNLNEVSETPDFTRDILYVNGKFKNKTLHIFVTHFPSKRNQDINRNKRIFALQILHTHIEEIFRKETQPAIMIFGDMNENPTQDILQNELEYTSDVEKVSGDTLYNPFYQKYQEGEYSLYHKNDGMLFDQIILSPYFFNAKSELLFSNAEVFDDLLLKEWKPQFHDKPFRTYVGRKYLGGYSDHFPVFVSFNDKVDPLAKYIDSTYLKTPQEAGITEEETFQNIQALTQFAIDHHIKCIMIRPKYVRPMKQWVEKQQSSVHIGTVIDFPLGTSSLEVKRKEAQQSIADGADELDFVMNYDAYIQGDLKTIKNEFIQCTKYTLEQGKIVKWIIETAALESQQIKKIGTLFSEWSQEHFKNHLSSIYVKSSTGYYPKELKGYSGATPEDIQIMLTAAYPLPIKASGGIKNRKQALHYISMGVSRLGTSSAEIILNS